MATKLSAGDKRLLESVGIKGLKTQEEALKLMIPECEKFGYESTGDDEFSTILDMYVSIVDYDKEGAEKDEEPETEEELDDEEDDEAGESDEEPEEEKDDESEEALAEDSDEEMDALSEEVEKEDKEEEKKKSSKKGRAKKTAEEVEESEDNEAEPVKTEEKVVKRRGTRLNPKDIEEDREFFKVFHPLFPESDCSYNWIANAGVSIKHNGKNSNRVLLLIENVAKSKDDQDHKCNCYFPTMTKAVEVLEETYYEISKSWNNVPFIKQITFGELLELIPTLTEHIFGKAEKIDERLGKNRERLEKALKSEDNKRVASKTKGKKTSKKVKKEGEEDGEE